MSGSRRWEDAERAGLREALVQALAALDAGDDAAAADALSRIGRLGDSRLVHGIASLTRSVHETLRELDGDGRLAAAAGYGLTDTRGRLSRVVALTTQAATRTMDHAERITGLCRELEWMVPDAGPEAAGRLAAIAEAAREIVAAQGYQDLTGQLVDRALSLITLVEERLVALLRSAGVRPPARAAAGIEADGPAHEASDAAVRSQDEVDALLQSLGV